MYQDKLYLLLMRNLLVSDCILQNCGLQVDKYQHLIIVLFFSQCQSYSLSQSGRMHGKNKKHIVSML